MDFKSLLSKIDDLHEDRKTHGSFEKLERSVADRAAADAAAKLKKPKSKEKDPAFDTSALASTLGGKLPKNPVGVVSRTHKTPDFDIDDEDDGAEIVREMEPTKNLNRPERPPAKPTPPPGSEVKPPPNALPKKDPFKHAKLTESGNPITAFASMAHEQWRKGYDPTGTKPRIKKNSDGTEGDINQPFDKIHPDWQHENLAAGKAAYDAVQKYGNDMEAAAKYIHDEWMKRNPKGDWNAAQHVPYDKLPEEEKEKDRVHVRTMMKLLGKQDLKEYRRANNSTTSGADEPHDPNKPKITKLPYMGPKAAYYTIELADGSTLMYSDRSPETFNSLEKAQARAAKRPGAKVRAHHPERTPDDREGRIEPNLFEQPRNKKSQQGVAEGGPGYVRRTGPLGVRHSLSTGGVDPGPGDKYDHDLADITSAVDRVGKLDRNPGFEQDPETLAQADEYRNIFNREAGQKAQLRGKEATPAELQRSWKKYSGLARRREQSAADQERMDSILGQARRGLNAMSENVQQPRNLKEWMNRVEGISEAVVPPNAVEIPSATSGSNVAGTLLTVQGNDPTLKGIIDRAVKDKKLVAVGSTAPQSTTSATKPATTTPSSGTTTMPVKEEEIDEVAAPGQEKWIKANKKRFIDQYGKKKGMSVLYATAWKRSKGKSESMNESKSPVMEGYTLEDILKRYPHETKVLEDGWGVMDENLYEALRDYYFENGFIPRKVMYGDHETCRKHVMDCYAKDRGMLVDEGMETASPGDAQFGPLEEVAPLLPLAVGAAARAGAGALGVTSTLGRNAIGLAANRAVGALTNSDEEDTTESLYELDDLDDIGDIESEMDDDFEDDSIDDIDDEFPFPDDTEDYNLDDELDDELDEDYMMEAKKYNKKMAEGFDKPKGTPVVSLSDFGDKEKVDEAQWRYLKGAELYDPSLRGPEGRYTDYVSLRAKQLGLDDPEYLNLLHEVGEILAKQTPVLKPYSSGKWSADQAGMTMAKLTPRPTKEELRQVLKTGQLSPRLAAAPAEEYKRLTGQNWGEKWTWSQQNMSEEGVAEGSENTPPPYKGPSAKYYNIKKKDGKGGRVVSTHSTLKKAEQELAGKPDSMNYIIEPVVVKNPRITKLPYMGAPESHYVIKDENGTVLGTRLTLAKAKQALASNPNLKIEPMEKSDPPADREGRKMPWMYDEFDEQINKKTQSITEETKETKTGRVHKAEPGGYGRKDDEDDEGKKVKKDAPKRGRGRPKKDADSETGEVKKWDTETLARWIVGSKPKTLPGKASVKHKIKDESAKKSKKMDAQMESWDRELKALLNEGMTITTSTGQPGGMDSVSVSATDSDAQTLLKLLQDAGIGLGGKHAGMSGEHSDGQMISVEPAAHEEVMSQLQPEEDSGDEAMDFLKRMIGARGGDIGDTAVVDVDYESEGDYEHAEHDHDDEESCEECGHAPCDCDAEKVDEDEVEEGNAFTGALAKARADGVQAGEKMKVDGKEYPVKHGKKMDEEDEHDSDDHDSEENDDEEDEEDKDKVDEGQQTCNECGGAMYEGHQCESEMNEMFHYSADKSPAGQRAANKSKDVLGRRPPEGVARYGDEYRAIKRPDNSEQRRVSDMFPIAGPKGKLPESELNEWANSPMGKSADEDFKTEIEYMTKLISGGLNGQKRDQTTLPHTKVKAEVIKEDISSTMKKLAGIK